ncbi:hypothetical protein KUM42_06900 [Modestobacter sp. L9-4]|uniref:hypothetical protein n=1 Tax=Modestobacter sp. L9-4 TaxID=2851567 RepID=UPI001C7725A6|nr:hypothetical protein [Modestobacter sp. L9-4]QXG77237.1 hypothetical protein KUM42_06900 [Modestobacter sp. L9-4]
MTSTAPDPADTGSPPDAVAAVPRPRVRPGRPARADVVVAAGTVVFLVLLLVPWYRREGFDLGYGHRVEATSANGLDSGLLVTALVLLVLASAWALLPAVADVPTPFPRALVTTGLVALAFLVTVLAWLSSLDLGFSLPGLLAVLTVAAMLAVSLRRLLPQARAWVAAERAQDVT